MIEDLFGLGLLADEVRVLIFVLRCIFGCVLATPRNS